MMAGSPPVLVLVLALLALSCFHRAEAIFEIGRGSASFKTAFFTFGFSVCHQSEVCGENGVTYQSPCEMEDDEVEMACRRACPCKEKKKKPTQHVEELPVVEDIWVAAPTAIIITPPPEELTSSGVEEAHIYQSGHGSGEQQGYVEVNVWNEICNQHADPGSCRPSEYTVQYYYDFSRESCSPFLYGGCDGNSNRFNSREECENACGSRNGD